VSFGPEITTASVPIGDLTCFAIGTTVNGVLVGNADVLCGLPGFSTLGA
jgi:hypothetical protein